MSVLAGVLADLLVAVLLVATIVTSTRLSRRIGQMKGDEALLRGTIADLVTASGTAERAIAGLRAAIDECDRTLSARLDTAGHCAAEIAGQVEAGEQVVARIAAIVGQARGRSDAPAMSAGHAFPTASPPPPAAPPPAVTAGPNGERLGAAAAAALAMTERALSRVRSRAA